MKSLKKQGQPTRAETSRKTTPRGKLWLFRLVALLLPILLLGLVEIVLRLGNYGYDPGFFQKTKINGQEYFINNDTFSLRFFPPTLARWPGTLMIPAHKPPDTVRIFVFGESAAMGDPQPAYGASRYLEVLLRERFPGKKFEVVNVAFTAINSHVILPIARECARHNGDIWIVYMGNNEMVGPFGAATVFGSQAPPRALVRLSLAIQQLRVGQLAMAGMRKLAGKSNRTAWGGMQMFLQNQIPPSDPRRETVYRNFEANLRDIVATGLDSGAKMILNTMSVNLRDCPPFASLANSNLPASDRMRFQQLYADALNRVKQGDLTNAAQQFEQAAKIDPQFAELQFHRADCLLQLGNRSALTNYQLACDADALPFRADSRINSIIRRLANEFSGSALVLSDAETALATASPHNIAGNEVFFEHVHFSFFGNYLLGRQWAEEVRQFLPESFTTPRTSDWATKEVCDRDLGLTIWNRSFAIDSVIQRMQQPPLSSQWNNPARLAMLRAELKFLRAQQTDTNTLMRSGQALVDAIQRAPQDPFLQEGFANFLEAVGDFKQAAGAYQKLLDLLPHDFYGKLQLGRLRAKLGQFPEGEALLQQAAQQRPSVPNVWMDLGGVQMAQQKYTRALASFTRGLALRPEDAGFLCQQANALARLNQNAEAMATYRRAIQLRPELPDAHFELACLLATDRQTDEALREFAETIRLNPRHIASRVSLGLLLEQLGRLEEASQQFQAALQLDPGNSAAAEYLRQNTNRRNQGALAP